MSKIIKLHQHATKAPCNHQEETSISIEDFFTPFGINTKEIITQKLEDFYKAYKTSGQWQMATLSQNVDTELAYLLLRHLIRGLKK